jgi:hypothetical protein
MISCPITEEELGKLLDEGNLSEAARSALANEKMGKTVTLNSGPFLLDIPEQIAREVLREAEKLGLSRLAHQLRGQLGPTY